MKTHCKFKSALSAAILLAVTLHAADEPKKVLSTSTVNVGTHSVIYQRVEAPKEVAAPVTTTAAATAAATMSREEAIAKWNRERTEPLSLSCTVYESGLSEVRWRMGDAEYRVLSNIDFNHVRGLGGFTADGRNYSVFLGIGSAMSASTLARLQASGTKLPASVKVPVPDVSSTVLADLQKSASARYVVLSAPEKTDADAFRGIDALHHHYDAHKAELIAVWKQSEADRTAHEQWVKDHPPGPPPDTVIQFWPVKGSRYLGKEAR